MSDQRGATDNAKLVMSDATDSPKPVMSDEGGAVDSAECEKSDEGSATNSAERVMSDKYTHWTDRYWPKPRLYPNRNDTSLKAKRYFEGQYGRYSTAYSVALGDPGRLQRLLEKLLRIQRNDAGLDKKGRRRLKSLRFNVNLLCQAIGLQIGQREAGARRKKPTTRATAAKKALANDAIALRAARMKWRTDNNRKNVPMAETLLLLAAIRPDLTKNNPVNAGIRRAILYAEKRGRAKSVNTTQPKQGT
jgi:hypothetical protein